MGSIKGRNVFMGLMVIRFTQRDLLHGVCYFICIGLGDTEKQVFRLNVLISTIIFIVVI